MENDRNKKQDQATDLDNAEVTELEDKDLEDASGGLQSDVPTTGSNMNCSC